MDHPIFTWLAANYHWQLSLLTAAIIFGLGFVGKHLFALVPAFRAAGQLNRETFRKKMDKPSYAAIQKKSRKWGGILVLVTYAIVLPFCLTLDPVPWWNVLLDIAAILMVYDFFYYFSHRFLFHDGGPFNGPLMWMHAVHHRQHNPCKDDSNFLHPLELAIGMGLYLLTIFVLSRFMGNFHVVTVVITWIAYAEINLHNHNLWESDRFPFRYLNYVSKMHHNHHARFTGGNYATITVFYDWLFGTLDHGDKPRKASRPRADTSSDSTPAQST